MCFFKNGCGGKPRLAGKRGPGVQTPGTFKASWLVLRLHP